MATTGGTWDLADNPEIVAEGQLTLGPDVRALAEASNG
jgi:hypothetical protein